MYRYLSKNRNFIVLNNKYDGKRELNKIYIYEIVII